MITSIFSGNIFITFRRNEESGDYSVHAWNTRDNTEIDIDNMEDFYYALTIGKSKFDDLMAEADEYAEQEKKDWLEGLNDVVQPKEKPEED